MTVLTVMSHRLAKEDTAQDPASHFVCDNCHLVRVKDLLHLVDLTDTPTGTCLHYCAICRDSGTLRYQ